MQPTTIRLPATTLEDLDSEYGDYGYRDRSEYIRDIIEHRDPPFETTATTSEHAPPTTDDYDVVTTADYERLRDRVAELEARVEDLEEREPAAGQTEAGASVSSIPKPPELERYEPVVEFIREWGPVRRSEITEAFEGWWQDDGLDPTYWWRHKAKPAVEEAGGERTPNRGWEIKD